LLNQKLGLGIGMIGLLLLGMLASIGGWFAWLYFVSPPSDLERIKADRAGTGVRVIDVKRVGAQHDRAAAVWVGNQLTPVNGGKWFRVYEVTLARPGEPTETCTVGVEACLFGLPELKRYEPRAGA
jgi:hypothetical protein